jgi:hypothetical protein
MILFRSLTDLRRAVMREAIRPGDCIHIPPALLAHHPAEEHERLRAQLAAAGAHLAGAWGSAHAIVVHGADERTPGACPASTVTR